MDYNIQTYSNVRFHIDYSLWLFDVAMENHHVE